MQIESHYTKPPGRGDNAHGVLCARRPSDINPKFWNVIQRTPIFRPLDELATLGRFQPELSPLHVTIHRVI
jgi:hypothetical protein